MGRRSDIDWEAIERDYRTTALTLTELSRKHGVTVQSICKRAKGHVTGIPWSRDLSPNVIAATRRRLLAQAAAEQKAEADRLALEANLTVTAQAPAIIERKVLDSLRADELAVEAQAELNARIIREHRGTLGKVRSVVERLLSELDGLGLDDEKRDGLMANLQAVGFTGAEARAVVGAVTMGSRLEAVKELSNALARLIPLERSAYGIDDAGEKGDSFEAWARSRGIIQ